MIDPDTIAAPITGEQRLQEVLNHVPYPEGYLYIRRSGGLDLTSSLEAKFGARFSQVHQNKRKNLGSSVTTRRKSWGRITILGAFGVISEIQRAQFGVFVTYIFGGKIWGSYTNFRGKFWGQAPPHLPIWKYTPGTIFHLNRVSQTAVGVYTT